MVESTDIAAKEKRSVETNGELTHAGPVFVPAVDIFESEDALILIADMPGVRSEGVDIHLKDNELTISGRAEAGELEGITAIYAEYESGGYLRSFTLSNVIDQSKIDATMKDGVLKIILPKAAAAKPRQITVKAV